jgi:hypothetical protein
VSEEFPFQKAHDAIVSMLHDYLAEKEHAERLEAENARLKAKVERLTKAGDAMARVVSSFGFDEAPIAWSRAKEGKPHA